METNVLEKVGELNLLATVLAHVCVNELSGADLQTLVVKNADTIRKIDAANLHILSALAATKSTTLMHGLRTEDWVAQATQIPKKVALQKVRVAVAVTESLPAVDLALSDGLVGFEHVAALVGVMRPENQERLCEFQADLVAAAHDQPRFEVWTRELGQLASNISRNNGYDPSVDMNANKLYMEPQLDGAFRANIEMWDMRGELARQALNREADNIFHELRNKNTENKTDVAIPGRASLLAEAFIRLVLRGAKNRNPHAHTRPVADVLLVINATDKIGDLHTPGDVRLQDVAVQTMLCDAQYTPIVVNNLNEPLAFGQKRRLASPAQIKALIARDAGCVGPGCDMPPEWCDAHHVEEYKRDEGPTNIDNLALLCRNDHGFVHCAGTIMRKRTLPPPRGDTESDEPYSHFEIVTPNGKVVLTQHRQHREQRNLVSTA